MLYLAHTANIFLPSSSVLISGDLYPQLCDYNHLALENIKTVKVSNFQSVFHLNQLCNKIWKLLIFKFAVHKPASRNISLG